MVRVYKSEPRMSRVPVNDATQRHQIYETGGVWGELYSSLTHWPLGDVAAIFKLMIQNSSRVTPCIIALMWISLNTFDDESLLVQVMAWCSRVTSNYLIQLWESSTTPYGVTRPLSVINCWRNFSFINLDRWRAQVYHQNNGRLFGMHPTLLFCIMHLHSNLASRML